MITRGPRWKFCRLAKMGRSPTICVAREGLLVGLPRNVENSVRRQYLIRNIIGIDPDKDLGVAEQ